MDKFVTIIKRNREDEQNIMPESAVEQKKLKPSKHASCLPDLPSDWQLAIGKELQKPYFLNVKDHIEIEVGQKDRARQRSTYNLSRAERQI